MIAEIVKGSRCENFIDYNENKVDRGEATRIYGCATQRDRASLKNYLNASVAINERVKKNKFQHIMVSFHADDKIDSNKFIQVWNRYAEEMNFNNCDQVIYEHRDTHLTHYHIIMPTVDFAGNKISEYQDFKRNRDTCRMLEKELGLYEVKYEALQQKRVNTKNAKIYSIYNYVRSQSASSQKLLNIPDSFKDAIVKYKMTNTKVLENFPGYSKESYKELLQLANESKINKKQSLIDRVREIKQSTKDYDSFEKAIRSECLYVRRIKINEGYKMI